MFLWFSLSLPGAVSVSEVLAPRAASRAALDASGAKPKLGCPKDNWHGYVEVLTAELSHQKVSFSDWEGKKKFFPVKSCVCYSLIENRQVTCIEMFICIKLFKEQIFK